MVNPAGVTQQFATRAPSLTKRGRLLPDSDSRDHLATEQVLHAGEDGAGRPTNLPGPSRVVSAHRQHTRGELDRRDPRERRTDGELPGKRRPLVGRRLSPDDFREHAGGEILDRHHGVARNAHSAQPGAVKLPPTGYYQTVRLILASASPRRAELLTAAGFTFEVRPADVDETPRALETPGDYARRVARDKAEVVARGCRNPGTAVLAADTVVVARGQILGKPADDADARAMLETLSGAVHEVQTAVVLLAETSDRSQVVTTRVRVLPLSDEEISWYIASGETRGKAGAYAIQGYAARFIDHIEGSWSNVVGLPLATVYRMLKDCGILDDHRNPHTRKD